MAKDKSSISMIGLIISLITLVLVVYMIVAPSGENKSQNHKIEKRLAGELADNSLYRASIEEYKKIIAVPDIDFEIRANINYLIAKIHFENLLDYENAAAHFIKARSLNSQGSFYDEAGKNLIACLEKMGRMVDAKRELDKAVNLDSIYAAHEGETVVARIGGVPIFLFGIDDEIQNLPAEIQKQYLGKEGKLTFLNQYIGLELMYRAAVREGFGESPDIIKKKEALNKQLMIEKYITEKVLPNVNIDTTDMMNYYLAHKSDKYDNKSIDDVKTRVFMDYQQEKAQKAFSDYVARLSAVEKVQIFEENIK